MNISDIFHFDRDNEENFEKLVERMSNHPDSVVPFVGAGLSSFAYPQWGTALKIIADNARVDDDSFSFLVSDAGREVDDHALEKAAQILSDVLGNKIFRSYLYSCFSPEKLHDEENRQALINSACSILPELFNDSILTTNFDHTIQEVYTQEKRSIVTSTPTNHEAMRRALRNNTHETHVFMLHGDIDSTEDIVINTDTYNRVYEQNSDLKKLLSAFYSQKTILFLGCSLQVDRTMELLEHECSVGDEHFAIISCRNAMQNVIYRKLRARMIYPIIYQSGKYESVKLLLEELLKRTRPSKYSYYLDKKDRLGLWQYTFKRYQKSEHHYNAYYATNTLVNKLLPSVFSEKKTYDNLLSCILDKNALYGKHIFAVGVGGSGKTASMIYVWNHCLSNSIPCVYIPLNRLDTDNYKARALEEWIKQNILIFNDAGIYSDFSNYSKFLSDIASAEPNSFILLLDGVNEMSHPDMLLRMLEWWQSQPSVKIVICSRTDDYLFLGNDNKFTFVEFNRLSSETVDNYLSQKNIHQVKESSLLFDIIKLPQMLTIYAGTSAIRNGYASAEGLDWREHRSVTDVIHNYFECQVAELAYEKCICNLFYAKVLVHYILPTLAWHMSQSHKNYISRTEISNSTKVLVDYVNIHINDLPFDLEVVLGNDDKIRNSQLLYVLFKQMHFFDFDTNQRCYFVHQNFYDYLVKEYWITVAKDRIDNRNMLSDCWTDSVIPTNAIEYVSETEGAYIASDYAIISNFYASFRSKVGNSYDRSIFNLIRIYAYIFQNDFSNFDFSNIDLSYVSLSGLILSKDNFSACFRGSVISDKTFAPNGHHAAITQVFFLRDDDSLLYAKDLHGNVGVYDLMTGIQVRKFTLSEVPTGENILYYFSTPENFYIPDKRKTFLGTIFSGMVCYNPTNSTTSYFRKPRSYMMHPACFVARCKKWLIMTDDSLYFLSEDETAESSNCVTTFSKRTYHSNFHISADSSTVLIVRVHEIQDKASEEEVYIVKTDPISIRSVSEGPLDVSLSRLILSEDGMIILKQQNPGVVDVINSEDWKLIKTINTNTDDISKFRDQFSISYDHQWLVSMKPSNAGFKSTWNIMVWNIYIDGNPLIYSYNDIVLSNCFTTDNSRLIVGLFDGSIDEINLMTGNHHRIAYGYRVDLELYNVHEKLLIKRNDGSSQLWDYQNLKVASKRNSFDFPALKEYSVSSNGRTWYRLNYENIFETYDSVLKKKNYIKGHRFDIISNEADNHVLAISYKYTSIAEINWFMIDLTYDPHDIECHSIIAVDCLVNIGGLIKCVHLTNDRRYCIILWEQFDSPDPSLIASGFPGKPCVLIWDLNNDCLLLNQSIPGLKSIYADQKYAIHSLSHNIVIFFYHSSRIYTIDLRNPAVHELKYSINFDGHSCIISTRNIEDINAISIGVPESIETHKKFPSAMAIAPDGTVYTSQDGTSLDDDDFRDFDEAIKTAMSNDEKSKIIMISTGDILCSDVVSDNALLLGCSSGVLLMILTDGDLCNNNFYGAVCFNESDFRVYSLRGFIHNNHHIEVAAQKDDNIYAWDLDAGKFLGKISMLPCTDVYHCDFQLAKFENDDLKRLIEMNGGLV